MREMKDSGIEWLGEIPAGWEIRQVGQLAEVVKAPNEGLAENNLLSLSYGKIKRRDINAVDGLLPASFETYNIIQPNDIVLRFTDLQNDQKSLRVGRATERGIITSAYVTVRPHDAFRSRFIYYALHAYDLRKGFYGMGAGVRQGLKWQEARYIRLPWPGEERQRRIADYLDEKCAEIDRAISAAEQSIEEYRAYRYSLVSAHIDTSDGAEVRFKYIAAVVPNLVRPDDYPDLIEVDPDNIEKDTGRLINLRSVYEVGAISAKHRFKRGQILYSKIRPLLGKVAIAPFDGLCSADMYPIETGQDVEWLRYAMTSASFRRQVASACARVKMPKINVEQLGQIRLIVPSLGEQRRIVGYLNEKCSQADSAIEAKQAIIADLKAYKQSLIYEVVTGKREV